MSEHEPTPKLADIINAKQKVTGNDVPEGTYPGTLYGYSDPFWLTTAERFRKPGQPEKRLMIRAEFGITLQKGGLESVGMMFPVPQGELHRKSNAYKFVKALASSDPEIMNANGDVSDSFTLARLIGKTAMLAVKNNEKGFPQVDGLLPPLDGGKYPSLEDCKPLAESGDSGKVPF